MSWVDLTGDPEAGKSNKHDTVDTAIELRRGTGRANVQVIILTPTGRLLHVMTGYVAPKELLWELEQALKSWKAVKEAARTAELSLQKAALVRRQEEIHKAWLSRFVKGKHARTPWIAKHAQHDRDIVEEFPLAHAGTVRTVVLTGGNRQTFGYQSGSRGVPTVTRGGGAGPVIAKPARETEAAKRVNKRRNKLLGGRGAAPAGGASRGGSALDR